MGFGVDKEGLSCAFFPFESLLVSGESPSVALLLGDLGVRCTLAVSDLGRGASTLDGSSWTMACNLQKQVIMVAKQVFRRNFLIVIGTEQQGHL